jgi:L-alanine-DL-glutamate epimerase-like enolase superfamily enzyme
MVITDIRPVLLTTPYGIAGAHINKRCACFVEVHTDEGIVGVGETYSGVYMPELSAQIVEFFKPFLLGRDITNPNKAYRDCYWISSYIGRSGPTVMVLGAIECAMWDALGKLRGAPVHELLGGAVHERLPMYASGGVPHLSIEQLQEQATWVREQGYQGYKMRANLFKYQPEIEAERVAAVREVLGPDLLLAMDAVQNFNLQPWSLKQIVRMLERLEPYDLGWAEEFLPPFDPAPYAELRKMTPTPITGGEGITTFSTFEQWLRAGAFDIAQPDPTIIGGIGEARRACEAAAARHTKVAVHVWGSAPTVTSNYHLAFTQPNCIWLERPVMNNPLDTEMLVEPLPVEDGYCLPPTSPGLGVEITDELKAKYPYEPGSASAFG